MFDYHCPMLSLPAVLKTDIDTVPWNGAYITANPDLVREYRSRLPEECKIGLCWSSGIRKEGLWISEYGSRKSMHFKDLSPLLAHGSFVSLQVGPEREQNDSINDVLPEKPTWDDTAALVAGLELIITVDTSVAHLAGAMGKPTWLMMHTEGSWHWMVARPDALWNETSPWYPSVRIFRQTAVRDWCNVIAKITEELGVVSGIPVINK